MSTVRSTITHLLSCVLIVSAFTFITPSVYAASPDGLGPWADTVSNFTQGQTKSAGAVPAPRSDPTAALGVAENDTVEPHFVSLGFGGSLTLGFDNGFKTAVIVVEATNLGYPTESANVEVSADGSTWVSAGAVTQDGQVTVPQSLNCAKFVRITDTSNIDLFSDATADAYDVDGVQVTGETCTPPPPPDDGCCCGCGPTSNVISGNGPGSTNVINTNCTTTTTVTQTNNSTVISAAVVLNNTGGNKIKNNSGDATIKTGNAKSRVKTKVGGSKNISH